MGRRGRWRIHCSWLSTWPPPPAVAGRSSKAGLHHKRHHVFGDRPGVVELFGPVTASLVQALPEIERRLDRRITVVGGLAVLSRLGSAAHRVTSDVDTVNRRLDGEPGQLDVLLATGATAIDG